MWDLDFFCFCYGLVNLSFVFRVSYVGFRGFSFFRVGG